MPQEFVEYGSPEEWLDYAKGDLIIAEMSLRPGIILDQLCFHTQQSVEKSLKAVLIHAKIPTPYTHDINRLFAIMKSQGLAFPVELQDSEELTQYASLMRYPGPYRVTKAEYLNSVAVAKKVLAWAETVIGTTP